MLFNVICFIYYFMSIRSASLRNMKEIKIIATEIKIIACMIINFIVLKKIVGATESNSPET